MAEEKIKVYREGKEPTFPSTFEVPLRKTLNFTDIVNNNNKYYNLELQLAPTGEARVYTVYGRVGAVASKEYRVCKDRTHAETVLSKIIREKTRKGYVEVELAKADIGSEVGQAKVEAHRVKVEDLERHGVKIEAAPSKLHREVQGLVSQFFAATAQFVELNLDTKKCPLGQLSFAQITKGKDILNECRTIIGGKRPDNTELNHLTNQYYSNIPHNLGHASKRLDADTLRFDSNEKIDRALDILDVLGDAKSVEKVLSGKSSVDAQYETLKADITFVDPESLTYKWIERMFLETRAPNHDFLGKLKLHRVFEVARHGETTYFDDTLRQLLKECKGKHELPSVLKRHVPERPDVPKELLEAYRAANVLPVWHGTRRANMVGITQKGLLIRPSGVVHAGSAFGDGIYWASNSTKSINYTDARGSYWAQGSARTAFLFLADVAFGDQKVVAHSSFYTKENIRPYHSVWAKAGGGSYIQNDEFITYAPAGRGQHHNTRYVLEFETKA